MKNKIGLLLVVGVVLIAILGGLFLYKSFEIKGAIEKYLNVDMKVKIAKYSGENNLSIEMDDFSCSGLLAIKCVNKNISVSVAGEGVEALSVQDFVVEVDDFSKNALSFKSSGELRYAQSQDDNIRELNKAMLPNTFSCSQVISRNSKDTNGFIESGNCKLVANDMVFDIKNSGTFVGDKNLGLLDSIASLYEGNLAYDIDDISLTFTSDSISDVLFAISKRQYGEDMNKSGYDTLVRLMIGLAIASTKENDRVVAENILGGVEQMVLGEKNKLEIGIKKKNPNAKNDLYKYFKSLQLDPLLANLKANYHIIVKTSSREENDKE